jgi:hypothetical protein
MIIYFFLDIKSFDVRQNVNKSDDQKVNHSLCSLIN